MWRRTGVLTFDGNRKLKKKVTYRSIKEHLEQTHKTKLYSLELQGTKEEDQLKTTEDWLG